MKKMTTKLVSILASLSLVVGLIPTTALADPSVTDEGQQPIVEIAAPAVDASAQDQATPASDAAAAQQDQQSPVDQDQTVPAAEPENPSTIISKDADPASAATVDEPAAGTDLEESRAFTNGGDPGAASGESLLPEGVEADVPFVNDEGLTVKYDAKGNQFVKIQSGWVTRAEFDALVAKSDSMSYHLNGVGGDSGLSLLSIESEPSPLSTADWDYYTGGAYVQFRNWSMEDDVFTITIGGVEYTGYCQNVGLAAPADGYYSYWAEWDESEGAYYITVDTKYASAHWNQVPTGVCQYVGGFYVYSKGALRVHKTPDASCGVDVTNLPSVAGAEYALYWYRTDAEADRNRTATFTVGEDGWSTETVTNLQPDERWYIREVKAPEGYQLDPMIYTVEIGPIEKTGTAVFETSDELDLDPIGFLIQKVDAKTGTAVPVDSQHSLAGAQYTVHYYGPGKDPASTIADRKWVFETNANGYVSFNENFKVSGDELFVNSTGIPGMPVGTITVQETKPPVGYLNNDEVVTIVFSIDENGNRTHTTYGNTAAIATFTEIPIVLHTTATEQTTGEHSAQALSSVTIVDTVAYENVELGHKYTVRGTLMASDGSALKDASGNTVTSSATFNATATSGTVDVTYTFDASQLAGRSTVVFEELYDNADGELKAFHRDINDAGQTVTFIGVGTTATNAETDLHEVEQAASITLTDVVAYMGLTPGKEYTVSGVLMDKATGAEFVDASGSTVTATKTFTPTTADGTVEMTFTFDGTDMAGKTVVVFEDVLTGGKRVAAHADINDEGQTVRIIKIGTTAEESEFGEHMGRVDETVTIIDHVAYTNLTPGKQYELRGTLVNKANGETIVDADGNAVTATKTFTPTTADGTVDVEFTFNSVNLQGKKTVVFENLLQEGIEVAAHTDINDEGQEIDFPEIHTTATDAEDGNKWIGLDKNATIIDVVSYTNLTPGKDYTVSGVLMDKATGEPFTDADGKEVRGQTVFTPTEANGTVDVTFTFNATGMNNKQTVVFEDLTRDGIEVVAHTDINDEGQTTAFPGPTFWERHFAPGYYDNEGNWHALPQTGDNMAAWIYGLLTAMIASAAMLLFLRRKTALAGGEYNEESEFIEKLNSEDFLKYLK